MAHGNALLRRFNGLPIAWQVAAIVAAAVVGSDLLTLLFYSIFFADRLLLDLVLTTVIVVVVATPLAYYFIGQNVRMTRLAADLALANRSDDLTGLLNRKTFMAEAQAMIATEAASAGVLLFIDADHFKSVNDTLGHAAGDAVLRELAGILADLTEEGDLAGRLGGEEFAVFLAHATGEDATRLCDSIRARAREIARRLGLRGLTVTVSIGVAVHEGGQSLSELLLRADKNLYAAKIGGRDRAVSAKAGQVA
jgi:diguanylate cyclase (GGDEF)-like protein